MSALQPLLDTYRSETTTERDKGTAFEKLVAAWLVTDPVQAQRFQRVQPWSDWAREQEQDGSDTGIDLVGTRHDGSLVAIQCKFFESHRSIQKRDIDSFISASGKQPFAERLIVETTEVPWSSNAEDMLRNQTLPTACIGLQQLRESPVDWSAFAGSGEITRPKPKQLRPDQDEALAAVRARLETADRGKLIMACGTGKTLTSLRIAEAMVGTGGYVLYLVPSLALMTQSISEWCADATVPLTAFAVCSDTQVGKRRSNRNDVAELEITDLAFPATTDASRLSQAVAASSKDTMRVVFATYQSISVIAAAQKGSAAQEGQTPAYNIQGHASNLFPEFELPEFDLILCDEAHRTTGATFPGEDESNFVKVHDNNVIRGRKRLYMTATPRIYGENAKSKARDVNAVLASMDDKALYGEVLFHHGFAHAVESDILTDYRVIVLAMDEGQVSAAVQRRLSDSDSELKLDDATKIVGCWKALSKQGLSEGTVHDPGSMQRAVAFCRDIKSSKLIKNEFDKVVEAYQADSVEEDDIDLSCEIQHVDGTYKARERGKCLDWLKAPANADACRILSNARCLTEGVDVPALDAILFLHPRNSQIDVVQAVGRVMRKAPDKRMGYVILPVGIPPGIPADQALNDNKRYKVVWQILNALRAHDERLDAVINQGSLGQDVSDRIAIIDARVLADNAELKAVTAKVTDLPVRNKKRAGIGEGGGHSQDDESDRQQTLDVTIDEFSRAIMAKIVNKCGRRVYWEDWAQDVAEIAEKHITRITTLVEQPESDAQHFFQDFLTELRDDLNEDVSEREAIEVLAQHLITRPVFDALFKDHNFVEQNPVSQAMSEVLSVIDEAQVSREAEKLEGFYASVSRRAAGLTDPQARQNLIVELYDKFFRNAFPRTTRMLGIVYTPIEIVDFIIKSVNETLQKEFGQSLGSKGVHIIDPFVGTGTFITRLLQSGLIPPEDLERKYREEIHANEIVLLAYYIAAINIETVFHALAEKEGYLPFEGICLTDTFALHEGEDLLSDYMKDNSDRRERQKDTDIRVIIGNPPYSAGQKSQNDNAKNVAYAGLDQRIRTTYAQRSETNLLRNLYDSYIRAIHWGSERLGNTGVMAYVTNAGWLDGNAMDGMRKCIADEFASVHVFHLRGNALTSGEQRRKEKGNVFGEGTRTPVAIAVFVKNPDAAEQGHIYFHDIGDYLDRKQKLETIRVYGSINGIGKAGKWTRIIPDRHGDWLNQRDDNFDQYLKVGDKRDKGESVLFHNYSQGVVTSRDAWCINPSRMSLENNITSTLNFYNDEVARWQAAKENVQATRDVLPKLEDFISADGKKISWSRAIKGDAQKGKTLRLDDGQFVPCLYRPFTKQWQYYSRRFNEMVCQMPQIFPNGELPNRVIAVTGKGGRSGFSALMIDALSNYHTIDTGQCFPLYLYEPTSSEDNLPLLSDSGATNGYHRHDAISEQGLNHFHDAYPGEDITREDIFHYVYGLLHSEDYRTRFRDNLTKDLPRIPCVKAVEDFHAFRDAGKQLGELHVGYESVEPYSGAHIEIDSRTDTISMEQTYRVTKMRHPGTGRNKDRSTVIYNSHITISKIPEAAWDYVVNGKPAPAWVMERQCVKTDKASGIISDANRYAIETVGDPRYPFNLFLRVITVSLETMRIVRALPEAVNGGRTGPRDLAKFTSECFAPLGGVELELPPRGPMREPPDFS